MPQDTLLDLLDQTRVIKTPVTERGREHSSFVPAASVQRIQEVISDLSLVDDGSVSIPQDRHGDACDPRHQMAAIGALTSPWRKARRLP
jgi:hypothetical protein